MKFKTLTALGENFAEMLDKLYEKAYKNDSDGVHEIIMKMTNS